MEMYQLRYLIKAVELGNLSRAAEELNVSQPAISRGFRNLEQEVDAKLFTRTPWGIEPTESGKALYVHAKSVINQTEKAKSELESIRGKTRDKVRIGISDTLQSVLIDDLLNLWKQSYPTTDLILDVDISTNLVKKTRSANVDFSVSTFAGLTFSEDLKLDELFTDEMVLHAKAGHDLAKKRKVTLRDLSLSEWATLGVEEDSANEFFNAHFSMRALQRPRIGLRASNLATLSSALLHTDMIAATPRYYMKPYIEQGNIVELSAPELELVTAVGLILPADRKLSDAQSAMCDLLRTVAKNLNPRD